jgi:hypothetical protein
MPNQDDKWAQFEDKGGGDKWAKYVAPETGPSTYSKLTAGYNPDVEQFAQNHPVLGPAVRFLDAAGGAAMATPEGIYNALRHPVDTAKGALESIAAWKDPNVRAGALSVLPEALGQGVGNVAGGEAIGAVAPKVVKGIPEAAKRTHGKIAETFRQEGGTGPIKPGVHAASRLVGMGAGHYTGIPGLGELGGYVIAPEVAEALIPKKSGGAPAAVGETAESFSKQQRSAAYEEMNKDFAKKTAAKAKADAAAAKAAEKLAKNAPPPNPFAGMTSSAAPVGSAELPPATGAQAPFPAVTRKAQMAAPPTPETPPSTGGPLDITQPKTSLLSRGRTVIQPGMEPDMSNPAHVKMINDYQTISGPKLRELAGAGDRFAAFVLRHMPRP